jgi:putative endopeptidase
MFGVNFMLAAAILATGGRPDVLRANIDSSANPGADFFAYGNGAWIKRHPIPPTESSWGIGNLVRDEIYKQLLTISKDAAKSKAKPGSDTRKVGDFWSTAMDQAKADRLGLTPLKPELKEIDSINTVQDAIAAGFELQRIGVGSFFELDVSQDEKQSDVMAVHINQGGLGLPDRDFYFNKEAGVAKIRTEYVSYLKSILAMAGVADSATVSQEVMDFETALAQSSRKMEDLRDPQHNYNKMPATDLQPKLTPSIEWQKQFVAWRIQPTDVVVGQPEFFTGLETLLGKTPVPVLRNYLKAHLVADFAAYLDKKAEALDFHFNHQVLSGQKEPQPRWKRALAAENQAIGFILGRIFVKNYFPEAAKARYSNLVEAIRRAYHKRIDRLDWMTPETKAKAHAKLNAVVKKVGFPDKWKDYSALKVGDSSFCENMMFAQDWQFNDMLSKFGKPVDRSEWGITPQTFDAYYDPANNEIVLPAAAFTIPGLKESQIDDALMYGNAGGSWIGHEITHGFDDQGRQFDAKGNLADWWTKEDAVKFQAHTALLVKQFNAYEPIKGIHINGAACLGENIADLGGVLLGLDAFKQTETYKKGIKVAGQTPMQRYFLAYTLSWLDEQRPESLRRQLLSDVHAPAKWRVNGPLSNISDFYAAFGIKKGQPMWREPGDRVHIW